MVRRKKGIVLTNLELEIMRALWEQEPVTVREVLERLNRGRRKPLAYNTVQTMLTILRDKKVVRSRPGANRAHVYVSKVSEEDVSKSMVSDLVDRLFDGNVDPLLVRLVESEGLGAAELRRLRETIDDLLQDREGRA